MAMRDAGIKPSQVSYVNAHATSTPIGDRIEAKVLEKIFGTYDSHSSSSSPPSSSSSSSSSQYPFVSSTKGSTGHLLGAAGAIEAAFSALSVRDNIVPPTKGLNNSEFQLNFVKENALKDCQIDYAISNSFGFGGTNSSLIFKKYQ